MTPASQRALKRGFDVAAAAVLLLLLTPLVIAAMIAIRLASPGPALFRQPRVGAHGRVFHLIKLRTMHVDAESRLRELLSSSREDGREWARYRRLRNDPRIIGRIGRTLRRTSLDEVPQLWNVLRGQMSLVGPRPLEVSVHHDLPEAERLSRERVPPGLTGLWQVSGRSETDIATLARLDADYVRTWSLRQDLRILFRTPGVVISRRGAY